ASVHPSAELHRCYIAPGATIGAGVEIDSSIIGPGAVVEEGAKLNRCILHANTTVSPSATVEGVVVPPHGSVTSSTVAHPVEGVTIGAPLPDTVQALAKLDAARASTVESSGTDEVADNEEDGDGDDGITGSLSGDEAFKQGFRTEVYSFFKEGWEEKQDVPHVCQQLRIYRTTEQAPLPELLTATVLALARVCCEVLVSGSNAGKPKQPLVSSFYEYWDDTLEELYLTDQAGGLPSWWLDTLDALCEYCTQRGGDLHKECCLFIWGMYANDFLSREDLLGWWSRAPDAYQQMPLMAQLVGQIEEESDESDDEERFFNPNVRVSMVPTSPSMKASPSTDCVQGSKKSNFKGNTRGKTTTLGAMANLVMICIGVGILGLPLVMQQAGWIGGYILLVVAGASSLWMGKHLADACSTYSSSDSCGNPVFPSYQSLGYMTYGFIGKASVIVTMDIFMLGLCVILLQLDPNLFWYYDAASMDKVDEVDSMAVDRMANRGSDDTITHSLFNYSDLGAAFGTLMTSFGLTAMIPSVMNNMEKPDKVGTSLYGAFAIIFSVYICLTVAGYGG
ncbi:hypothetical protein FOZ63_000351, partial [Perkinsus olseni]